MCQSSFAQDIIIKPCEGWQMKTTGIKVHHIITWLPVKLHSTHRPRLLCIPLIILTSRRFQPCPSFAYFSLVHLSKFTVSISAHWRWLPTSGELEPSFPRFLVFAHLFLHLLDRCHSPFMSHCHGCQAHKETCSKLFNVRQNNILFQDAFTAQIYDSLLGC